MMEDLSVTYLRICELLMDTKCDVDIVVQVIAINNMQMSSSDVEKFRTYLIKTIIPSFKERWQKVSRTMTRFLENNKNLLERVYILHGTAENEEGPSCSNIVKRGRPVIPFEESQPKTKMAKVREFCQNTSQELIALAAKKQQSAETTMKAFSPEKALSLLLDASFSKHQYEVLRSACKENGCDIFPLYQRVLDVKKKCYPEDLDIKKNFGKVSLQNLLDHTAKRLIWTKSEAELADIPDELTLISKWGCDGSSGHSEYNQAFSNADLSDKNMFLTSLVPLKLKEKSGEPKTCWMNNQPSSTRFCRPIKFEFVKETATVINAEIDRVNEEISSLRKTVIEYCDRKFEITHNLALTMIDRKVATTMTGSSAMTVCYICGAKPKERNNIDDLVLRENNVKALKLGISPLHARIKFMECILHIAYNKTFRAWMVNDATRPLRDAAKADIQKRLKSVLGIKVDFVKQGMGSTNDGNTSRRFFENPNITADILGVDVNLIHRFKIILATINCRAAIDPAKYQKYAMDTVKLYIELYGWYYMPPTVHKVLVQGHRIISEAVLPLGMLSEEAQEARNKDYRNYRLHHSRKCSRTATNEDVMHNLLVSSDPYINKFRCKLNIKKMEYHNDVKELLMEND